MEKLLTEQEQVILKLRSSGMTNSEIAAKLEVSDPYVSKTFKNISSKIVSVENTLQLLKETGYLDQEPSLKLTTKGLAELKKNTDSKIDIVGKIKAKTRVIRLRRSSARIGIIIKSRQYNIIYQTSPGELYHHQITKLTLLETNTIPELQNAL